MNNGHISLVGLFEEAIRKNWEFKALSDYSGRGFTYKQVGEEILQIHNLFRENGIGKGDKVSLLGKNSAQWGIIYIATITCGAVIVPILPDFKPVDVHHIVTHSDSVILIAEDFLFKDLDPEEMPLLKKIFNLHDFRELFKREPSAVSNEYPASNIQYPASSIQYPVSSIQHPVSEITPDMIRFPEASGEDLAVISYTSGTTGFSKGVMLQHKSLLGNILYAHRNMPLNPKDKILSFLPLAHTYGCAFEFLFPFTLGCDITFLTKTPSPKVIMQAFQEIRPSLILSVPLVIEKIYKTQILTAFRTPLMKALINTPLLNLLLYKKIRGKLVKVFGGNFRELVIGGAPFNTQAEKFFRKINFPFTVGYGMTECGPLISYASWKTTRLGASGRAVDELEVKIDSADQQKSEGEILVRGSHVMQGYYKNEDATRAVIDNEGWLHTGDLGVIDREGNIYIRGRSKSMILGPSGKNIYPEEIESLLNNRFLVAESLILERNEKLIALVYPDADAMVKAGVTREELPAHYQAYLHEMHHHLPKYIRISDFEIVDTEFEKTPKRSIKRFLYQ